MKLKDIKLVGLLIGIFGVGFGILSAFHGMIQQDWLIQSLSYLLMLCGIAGFIIFSVSVMKEDENE